MKLTISEIAHLINGEVIGDGKLEINSFAKIEEGIEGSITFLANPMYEKFIYSTQATAVIVNKDFVPKEDIGAVLIKVDDAYASLAGLLEFYEKSKSAKKGVHELSAIHKSCKIGQDVYAGEFATIGKDSVIGGEAKIFPNVFIGENVSIGKGTVLYPGVQVYDNCKIGADCIIHSGTIVGADGFGFAPNQGDQFKKVPQTGNVIIEDHVEIGSNTTIDRATIGSTVIRKGVKLDNLIQIAHNVEIGENTVIAAQTGVSGSTKIGKNCMIGGQVGIIGHLTIADGVKIAAQSGIGKSITQEGVMVQGSPAFGYMEYQKSYVMYRRLPDLKKQIDALEKKVKELESKLED
jgi:UDP-3-O-[3-hydroxymyristoyl] glucosamine N-acyltransferase